MQIYMSTWESPTLSALKCIPLIFPLHRNQVIIVDKNERELEKRLRESLIREN